MSSSSTALLGQGEDSERKSKRTNWAWYAVLIFFVLIVVAFVVGASVKHNNEDSEDIGAGIQCPGSPASLHAECKMKFEIPKTSCKDVKDEVERRIQEKDGWKDPKSHPGKYSLVKKEDKATEGTRTTGDGTNYVDKFIFTYADVEGSEKGCIVSACSQSQIMSVYDFSTNYCNMRNLLCGKAEGCKVSKHDLPPAQESFKSCFFHTESQCTR